MLKIREIYGININESESVNLSGNVSPIINYYYYITL